MVNREQLDTYFIKSHYLVGDVWLLVRESVIVLKGFWKLPANVDFQLFIISPMNKNSQISLHFPQVSWDRVVVTAD